MRNLVIMTIGDNSSCHQWDFSKIDFDIVFLSSVEPKSWWNLPNVFLGKGDRWSLISDFIDSGGLENYDWFWFVDETIVFNLIDVNNLFDICQTYGCFLAQPSIVENSPFFLLEPLEGSLLRWTDFVEMSCPLMSLDIVMKLKKTFKSYNVKWGIDFIWRNILEKKSMAIIDHIRVKSTKELSSLGLRFSEYPIDEIIALQKKKLDINTISKIDYYSAVHKKWGHSPIT